MVDWKKLTFFTIAGGIVSGACCWLFYPLTGWWWIPIAIWPAFVVLTYFMDDEAEIG